MSISGPRRERRRALFRKVVRPLLCSLIFALFVADGAASNPARATGKVTPVAPQNCARDVWRNATDNVWFYNQRGESVLPEVNHGWLVVHFRKDALKKSGSDGGPPPAIVQFNYQFKERIIDFVYDSVLDPNLCIYRIVRPENSGLLASAMAEVAGGTLVRYIRPAYTVEEVDFALFDEIGIRWKTQTTMEEKKALLTKIPTISITYDSGQENRIRIDPCRISVWEAANLLAEDLHVVSAWPILVKIEPPVRADFSVGINGATVGSPIPFSLEIAFSDHIRIEPSTLANLDLRPRSLYRNLFRIEFDKPLSSEEVTTSPVLIRGNLYLYGSGEFILPDVPVYYRDASVEKKNVRVIRTPEIPIRIASRIPRAPGKYRLIVAEPESIAESRETDLRGRKYSALGSAAAGIVLILGSVVGFRYLPSSRIESMSVKGESDAGSKSRSRFRKFLGSDPERIEAAELAAFGRAFRVWIGEICGLPEDALGGGAKVFFGTVRDCLPPEIHSEVYTLLEGIEASLTHGESQQEEVRQLVELGRSILLSVERMDSGKVP